MIALLVQIAKVILVALFIAAVIIGSLTEDKEGEDGQKGGSSPSGDNEEE